MQIAEEAAHYVVRAYKTVGGGREWFHVPKDVDLDTLIKIVDDEMKKHG